MTDRSVRLVLLLGIALLSATASTRTARAAELQTTDLRGYGGEALCLDVAGGVAAAGTDIILHACHGRSNQSFTFNRGTGEIRSALGDFCVDVFRGEATPGARVSLWSCNGSAAQKFDYDPERQRITFRGHPSLCLDTPRAEATARLSTCDETAGQRFTVTTPYGERRFDELTFLTAHNAFNNYEDSRWAAPNQSRGIGHALRDGVRGFMLDAHSFESDTARCVFSFGSDCYDRDVYLCHGSCSGFPGINYALPRKTLGSALDTIVDFLESHPDEIVTVFLEDYVSHDELRGALDRVEGLRALLFDPYAWNVRQNGWPRARDMVDANRRLLVFSDHSDKRDLGVAYQPDLTVENYWSIGDLGNQYDCYSRWDSIPLDRTEAGFQRLFVMNQFRNVPTVGTAAIDNGYGNLTTRMEQYCVPAAKRKPNFIAVDFYETGDARGVAAEVNDASAILFVDSQYRGRAQLLGPGDYMVGDLSVGNDAISSLVAAAGTSVVLYEHDARGGQSQVFYGSASFVGSAWNDRASSVRVLVDGAIPLQHEVLEGDFDGDGRADQLVYHGTTGDFFLGRSDGAALAWRVAARTAGFGNLLDGSHALYTGDFDGDGKTDVLFYYRGDGNFWLGRSDGQSLSFRLLGNASGFGNLLGGDHRVDVGDFDGDGDADVLFYYRGNGDYWLGRSDGQSLSWRRVGNVAGFGDLLAGSRQLFTGDFDASGTMDVMFYYRGDGNFWMGLSDGDSLDFHLAGNAAGFGDLLDGGHAFYTGDFDGSGTTDVMFYWSGNHDFWTGLSDGTSLRWQHAGNSGGLGDLLARDRRMVTGDFDGDGRSDVMFYYAGNGDLFVGRSNGSSFAFGRAGNAASYGNLLDSSRRILTGDYDGDGRTDTLFYDRGRGTWTSGRSSGSAFDFRAAGNTAGFGDFTR